MIGVGTLALVVYKLQKRSEKRNAAILVISQINELKELKETKLIINKDKEILTLTQENTDLKETVTTLNNTIENLQNNINDEIEDEDNKKD